MSGHTKLTIDQIEILLRGTNYEIRRYDDAYIIHTITYDGRDICVLNDHLPFIFLLQGYIDAAFTLMDILMFEDYSYGVRHIDADLTYEQISRIKTTVVIHDDNKITSDCKMRSLVDCNGRKNNNVIYLTDLMFRGRPISWINNGYIEGSYAILTGEDLSLDDYPEVTHIYNIFTGVETMRYEGDDSVLTAFDVGQPHKRSQ